jgi:hypothetical protein
MKKSMPFAVIVIIVLFLSASASANTVYVRNDSNFSVCVSTKRSFFFFFEIKGCSTTVDPMNSNTCNNDSDTSSITATLCYDKQYSITSTYYPIWDKMNAPIVDPVINLLCRGHSKSGFDCEITNPQRRK